MSDNDDIFSIDEAPEQEEQDNLEAQLETENIVPPLKLDYTLKTCAERNDLVTKILEQTPAANLTPRYLEILGDYIMGGLTKEERKSHVYVTDNRRITIDRRETSFEGLVEKFENGEDGIYNLISDNRHMFFQHKQEITEEDIKNIPGLKQLRDAIAEVDAAAKAATGKRKYLLKKQLIEMRKDQYVLKSSYLNLPRTTVHRGDPAKVDLTEHIYLNEKGEPQSDGIISRFNPEHISAILCNFPALKREMEGRFQNDFYYLVVDFEGLMNRALADQPMYRDIVEMKFCNKPNSEICEMVKTKYNETHSSQFISAIWRQKIPKHIAAFAQEEYLINYYYQYKPNSFKRCSCCKELKPANAWFFSKNNTSKDGFYSLCKKCRKSKGSK